MKKENVIGMFVGVFVGDMLGAPYEFMNAVDIPNDVVPTTGGAHNVTLGEWTDDGALTLATAASYIERGFFDPANVVHRFKAWRRHGTYGTRKECFDIGGTTDRAITYMTPKHPYAGEAGMYASGNGTIMRLAPLIAANHLNPFAAVAESVTSSLMTHGNNDITTYTAAFVEELFYGKQDHNKPLHYDVYDSAYNGTIMHSYSVAWWACHQARGDTAEALKLAVSLGGDTDTNAAVTGMLMGARNGIDSFPAEWLDILQQREHITTTAEKLYDIGCRRFNKGFE
jgi:ADP-ribosyl-[dinitrogen reductase] hydrolase